MSPSALPGSDAARSVDMTPWFNTNPKRGERRAFVGRVMSPELLRVS